MAQSSKMAYPSTTEMQGDEFWPLSGKPFFDIVFSKSHAKPMYQMVLPVKIFPVLPSASTPVVLTYRDKNWEGVYLGNHQTHRKISHNCWKAFVDENNLKAGDACVFELMECSNSNIKFRVQVLRGDLPAELLDKVSGESFDSPIVIE